MENRPTSAGDRKKWDAGAQLFVPPLAQQTLEHTCFTTIGGFSKAAPECESRSHTFSAGTLQKSSSFRLYTSHCRANGWGRSPDWQLGWRRPQEGVEDESRLPGAESSPGGGVAATHAAIGRRHHLWGGIFSLPTEGKYLWLVVQDNKEFFFIQCFYLLLKFTEFFFLYSHATRNWILGN